MFKLLHLWSSWEVTGEEKKNNVKKINKYIFCGLPVEQMKKKMSEKKKL